MLLRLRSLFTYTDPVLLFTCAAASGYGLLLVSSASAFSGVGGVATQAVCLCGGILLAVVISTVPPRLFRKTALPLAAFAVLLVLLTFTPLGYSVPGTDDRNWIAVNLFSRTFLFQPCELLKPVFVLTYSLHLTAVRKKIRRPLVLCGLLLHGIAPAALVFLQGDDGNAAVFLFLFAALFFAGGAPLWTYLVGLLGAAAATPFLWDRLSYDKQARFLCLFRVAEYENSVGRQQSRALIALGAGGLSGVGYRKGGDLALYARHNDFIFTVAGEEFGFLGSLLVIALLLLVLWRLFMIARRANTFGRLLCTGMMAYIGFQSAVNIGMTVRLFPVLGITLPFFSAGGSSLLTLFFGIGLALSAARFCTPHPPERLFGK